MTKFKTLSITEQSHAQLEHLSKITGLKMSNIISEILENITFISAYYQDGATFRCEHAVTEATVRIILHGYSRSFQHGHSSNDEQMHKDAKSAFREAEKNQVN